MKFIVGYQRMPTSAFLDEIIANKEKIKEVYFSFGNMPNGRGALPREDYLTEYEKRERMEHDLGLLARAGIKFNLLFNGNCYGRHSQSRALMNKVGDTAAYIADRYGLSSVTTSSPLIAKFVKANFDGIEVRASVNMEVGTVEGIDYLADYFDSFYIKRECNRNRAALDILSAHLKSLDKKMYLLANSGCLNFCSAHTFHDNLVSHESEIAEMDNAYQFSGACRDYLTSGENKYNLLARSNFIRPEDISLYEKYTDAVKLATRINNNPLAILSAYLKGFYGGSLTSLTEPDHTGVFLPEIIENKKLPKDFGRTVMECAHNCRECGYCKEALKAALVKLEDI